MQVLIWIVRIVVILLIVWFAARNAEPVELKGFLDSSLKAPLVLILLAFFGGGLLMGLLASLMTIFQLKREVRKLNRALQHKAHETSVALPPVSGNQNNA
jgi:uncharacterized integral membrane protein